MDELRISLLVIGVIVVAAIYLASWRAAKRMGSQVNKLDEATFEIEVNTGHQHWPAANSSMSFADTYDDYDEVVDFDELLYEINQSGLFSERHYAYPDAFIAANDAVKTRPFISDRASVVPLLSKEEAPEPLLIAINVIARGDNCFDPRRLKSAIESLGLQYDNRGVYHAYCGQEAEQAKPAGRQFSVTSITESRFDLSDLDTYRVPGLMFFLQLPGPLDGVDAFESMQKAAQAIAGKIGGVVCDAARSKLTKQVSSIIKDRISAFDIKLQTDYQPQIH